MKTPLIFDIKRGSTVDGPGVRTAIFFKGCNLDCFWCHNPEGKSPEAQMALFKEKCVACKTCLTVCDNSLKSCTVCGRCADTCPADARKLYGVEYTPDELLDIIKADKQYFLATDGGVTFSGGECMLYPDYITTLTELCKKEGISVAIDTAGCVPFSIFERVLPYTDIFLYDIKCLDEQLHIKGTGKSNKTILQNLTRLKETKKRIIIRIPVIPGFNDGEELDKIKNFCQSNALPYEFLPYHEFGTAKAEALKNNIL